MGANTPGRHLPSLMGRTATRSASLVPPTAGSNRQPTASESNKRIFGAVWLPTDLLSRTTAVRWEKKGWQFALPYLGRTAATAAPRSFRQPPVQTSSQRLANPTQLGLANSHVCSGSPAGQHMPFSRPPAWPHRLMASAVMAVAQLPINGGHTTGTALLPS